MHLRQLRTLNLAAAPQAGRPAWLSAASGLVRVGSKFYVVADDELQLGVFDAEGCTPGTLIRMLPGELPLEAPERKEHKPDFETLVLLPAFAGYASGALLALGSGSTLHRRRGVMMQIDRDQRVTSPQIIDAGALFDAMSRHVDDLNIEGAVAIDDRLLLLHRGNKTHPANAIGTFDLATFLDCITPAGVSRNVPLRAIRHHELDHVDGVPLTLTDLTALPDGRLLFSAVAENTADNFHDGAIAGAAVGIIGNNSDITALHTLDEPLKIEGIHAQQRDSHIDLWLVTDADDVTVPAVLLAGELSGTIPGGEPKSAKKG